ncbi:MAG: helix-turn-helix transcriptional regulator [Planctomycetes bacterium]|nr:helix-turn-helix transcriptional regulator [Planctomycetota bacterium]
MISQRLATASTIPFVLALLAEGESYGYRLIQRVRALSDGELDWSEGMLYPVLHRLTREGLVEARWDDEGGGRRRRYYRLTAEGRAALDAERAEWERVQHALAALWSPRHA